MKNITAYKWNQFLQDCKTHSTTFTCFDDLIHNITNQIQKLSFEDTTLNHKFELLQQKAQHSYETDICIDDHTCRVMLIALQPNAVIGLHNHPKQSGLIYCYQGEVEIDAYDETSATKTTAILKQIYATTLNKGEYAFLLPTRANIHRLKANQLSLLIDIFIPPPSEDYRNLNKRYTLQEKIPNTNLYQATIVPKS